MNSNESNPPAHVAWRPVRRIWLLHRPARLGLGMIPGLLKRFTNPGSAEEKSYTLTLFSTTTLQPCWFCSRVHWQSLRYSSMLFMCTVTGVQGMHSVNIARCRLPTLHSSTPGNAGRNHLPRHWDRRAIKPNHIKFRTCSAMWSPPKN